MKFKSLLSPKQIFTIKGVTYKANEGYLHTEDSEVISYLDNNPYWEALDKPVKKEPVKVEKKVEKVEPKKTTKKGDK
jgi:hypothetical protein